MKHHLQCAEEQISSSNITKCCACHAKWLASSILVTYETSFPMRGATSITLQPHQILRLPRKMILMIDARHTWHVIYNAQSNRSHPPTSPSAAPATQNDSHHLSSWHMKRHLQCAEKHASPSNLTKCCPCHEKWCASLIFVTYETLFTMRGATGITLQPHQILRLPRKITLQNQRKICRKQLKRQFQCGDDSNMIRPWSEHDPNMIRPWTRHLAPARSPRLLFALRRRILYWKLQHFAFRLSTQISPNTAPATKSDTPTSPNTAPATKNDAHNWLSWHMQRHLQCAEQQASPSNLTKCCACHVKSVSSWVLVSYETSFTMRRATDLILQHHQVLRLPRKMTRIIYPRDIWNVIYNARRNMHHLPTSPNAAPATKNDAHHWSSSHMKRYLQCAEQQASPSNLTKYCACHAKLHSKIKEKFAENSWSVNSNAGTIRTWSDHDPNMNSSSRTRPFAEVTFRASETHFVLKITTFRAPAIYSNFTEYCACHEKWHSNITKYCACHEKCHSKMTKYCACHEKWHSKITKYCACHEKWHWSVTLLSCYWTVTELSCYWAVTELLLDCHSTVTELTCYWAVTKLSCYSTATGLLLNCYWTDLLLSCYWTVTDTELSCSWAVTLLSCYLTELLLHWAVTWLSCYFTELLLYWTVPLLSCYLTALFLYWAVTLLSCYFTELLLYWAVTWLSCYFTELLLDWAVTLLSLYWAVTLLSCFFTELFLYWAVTTFLNLRNSEVSQLNFLW